MNKDYIIKGNTTFIADETGLHQRPTSSQIVKIMKLENDIETLKNFLKERKSKLGIAKFNKKNDFRDFAKIKVTI